MISKKFYLEYKPELSQIWTRFEQIPYTTEGEAILRAKYLRSVSEFSYRVIEVTERQIYSTEKV